MKRTNWIIVLIILLSVKVKAQNGVHQQSSLYEWPAEKEVRAKLDKWEDQKFGMLIHWGLYAVPGIIESWQICSENWIERDSTIAYEDYKKWYFGLQKDFNPLKFNPEAWAKAGKDAGMKYMIFTTKHHDGFSMFDTKETDFSIAHGPFASHPKKDVAKYVFDAFRKEGFMIGAYFSKPDWHSQYFWWSKYATPDRNTNYDIRKYPWRWNKFKQFAFNQINELMTNYGSIDILWLDGGWVRPLSTVNDEVRGWGAAIPEWDQQIDMPKIAAMARKAQPGLLMVDRTVHGPYENYQTPEQKIPEKQLDHPWESCLTLGTSWGYVNNEVYKPSSEVIRSLAEVVAKGGSLLLGVGPSPDGTLPAVAVSRMEEIGSWMKMNGKAIYSTRITADYHDGNTWFTQSKDGKMKNAVYCFPKEESPAASIEWKGNVPAKGSKMTLLNINKSVKWEVKDNVVKVHLPAALKNNPTVFGALAFTYPAK
ncbi:alpha-L-fucosidase [Pedobacter sp. AW31-3R]|uniref:alpha-L-fucosidase n=1 Tax=Pedobacter sp. AW31-3R TaxID=3445781 RepID=UPI003F9FF6D7